MRDVVKKSEEERKKENICKPIKVKDTLYYYWSCDSCQIAFFDNKD